MIVRRRMCFWCLIALGAIASAVAVSCERGSGGNGFLRLSMSDDYDYPEMSRLSEYLKSNGGSGIIPDTNDFILTVSDQSGKTVYEGLYSEKPEVFELPAGVYDVSVLSSEFSAPAYDAPRFGDSRTVIVNPGETIGVAFLCTQRNSGIRFIFDNSFLSEYSSGYFKVPSVGAGTANTEFEVLTGMSMRFFGPGEYPYKTYVKNNVLESAATALEEFGYGAEALHNNGGNFYSRAQVFNNMGFDHYTSKEFMNILQTTPKGWATDDILVPNIMESMDTTEGQDFVFTISVEGHGEYPTEKVLARYRELGGEILTLGSDAHAPEHIAYNFKETGELLKACGFRYYTIFKERKPEFLKL